MKKVLSIACMVLLIASMLSYTVSAADGGLEESGELFTSASTSDDDTSALPFVLEAPKYAFLDRLSDDVTEQNVNAAFTKNASMQEFMNLSQEKRTQALSMNGLATLKVTAQIDWAIDDPTGWHYDDYWDTDGEDQDGHLLAGDWAYLDVDPGKEKVCSTVIFEDFGDPEDKKNDSWKGFGYAKGWKDVLTEDQLTLNEETGHYYVNWEEHTLYIRVRYAVVTEDNDEENLRNHYFSGWSPVASFGKDVEEYYPYMTADEIPVPVLADLEVLDGDEETGKLLSFDVSIPKDKEGRDLEEIAARTEVYDGLAQLVFSVRFNEGEWVRCFRDVYSGNFQVPISEVLKDDEVYQDGSTVEVYAIIWMEQHLGVNGEWCGDLSTTPSNTIAIGKEDIPAPTTYVTPNPDEPTPTEEVTPTIVPPTPTVYNPELPEETIVVEEKKKEICKVCHLEIDPQPLGYCMFYWIGGAVALLIIIAIIVKIIRKKQDEATDILFR